MKHLLALMALCVAFVAGAQTGLVEFPYNPDADNDDLIGTADLLELLALFGGEFSEESLYLNNDSTHAIMLMGDIPYYSCMNECRNLPGNWHIANQEDLMLHIENLTPSGNSALEYWLHSDLTVEYSYSGSTFLVYGTNYPDYDRFYIAVDAGSNSNSSRFANSHNCICATQERRKVEYSYCRSQAAATGEIAENQFTDCCNLKVSEGWYPLGSTTGVSGNGYSNGSLYGQAFWRWAE